MQKKSSQDLRLIEEQTRAELFALRFQNAIGSLDKPHRIPELRKKIARILTLLTEREHAGDKVAPNLNAKTLQAEYKETMERMETENDTFRKKMESRIQAEQPGFNPDMFDEETLHEALGTEATGDEQVVEAQGAHKEPLNVANNKEVKGDKK